MVIVRQTTFQAHGKLRAARVDVHVYVLSGAAVAERAGAVAERAGAVAERAGAVTERAGAVAEGAVLLLLLTRGQCCDREGSAVAERAVLWPRRQCCGRDGSAVAERAVL